MNFLAFAADNARREFTPRRPIVAVCAWCPDHVEQTTSARAHSFDVSHTMCPACEARMNAEMDK